MNGNLIEQLVTEAFLWDTEDSFQVGKQKLLSLTSRLESHRENRDIFFEIERKRAKNFESGDYITRAETNENEKNLRNIYGDSIHITVNGASCNDPEEMAEIIAEKIEMKRKRREVSNG